jgi:hypothetical protein
MKSVTFDEYDENYELIDQLLLTNEKLKVYIDEEGEDYSIVSNNPKDTIFWIQWEDELEDCYVYFKHLKNTCEYESFENLSGKVYGLIESKGFDHIGENGFQFPSKFTTEKQLENFLISLDFTHEK